MKKYFFLKRENYMPKYSVFEKKIKISQNGKKLSLKNSHFWGFFFFSFFLSFPQIF